MDQERWSKVDEYLVAHLAPSDSDLDQALADSTAGDLPPINVAPNQGKFLELLARSCSAARILEIGTLGGYSAIWLARALPPDGLLVTLELEQHHADVARKNIDRTGLGPLVDIRVGPAVQTLESMVSAHEALFDFIFIDADKEGYPQYLDLSLDLSHSGTVIVADNVIRDGEVINGTSADERVHGVRRFIEKVQSNPRVEATAVQTVGSKGYDGFAYLVVR